MTAARIVLAVAVLLWKGPAARGAQYDSSGGIGVARDAVQSVFEQPENGGYVFRKGIHSDGNPRALAYSDQDDVLIRLVGPPENLIQATMSVGLAGEKDLRSAEESGLLLFLSYCAPSWKQGQSWLEENLPAVMGGREARVQARQGEVTIRLKLENERMSLKVAVQEPGIVRAATSGFLGPPPPHKDTAKPKTTGIGVGRHAIQSVFEKPSMGGFVFKVNPLSQGRPRVQAFSEERVAFIELIGPPEDLSSAHMGIALHRQDLALNLLRFMAFIGHAAPSWGKEGIAWLEHNADTVLVKKEVQTTHGHLVITMKHLAWVGVLSLSIAVREDWPASREP